MAERSARSSNFDGGPLHLPSPLAAFADQTFAVAQAEISKLRRDPTELLTRSIQPTLWLLIFGQVFTRARAISTGPLSYEEFLAPGVLAQSVLFMAIFYGIGIIWERDLGILQKVLISPAYRSALVLGKAVSAGVRGLVQAVFIYGLSLLMGVRIEWSMASLGGVVLAILLGSAVFSTFSLIVACLVKTRERFMGIGQVLTMPLFFASNAIYPLALMPSWLRAVSRFNPLTYLVDAVRFSMVPAGASEFGIGVDFLVLGAALVGLTLLAARLYPNVIR
jgi:ABC-2 type transport system permease protein